MCKRSKDGAAPWTFETDIQSRQQSVVLMSHVKCSTGVNGSQDSRFALIRLAAILHCLTCGTTQFRSNEAACVLIKVRRRHNVYACVRCGHLSSPSQRSASGFCLRPVCLFFLFTYAISPHISSWGHCIKLWYLSKAVCRRHAILQHTFMQHTSQFLLFVQKFTHCRHSFT